MSTESRVSFMTLQFVLKTTDFPVIIAFTSLYIKSMTCDSLYFRTYNERQDSSKEAIEFLEHPQLQEIAESHFMTSSSTKRQDIEQFRQKINVNHPEPARIPRINHLKRP